MIAYLQEEELDLMRVKRRTFRESLALRMKAMGELGRVLSESAGEAMQLLAGIGGDDEVYVDHHRASFFSLLFTENSYS